MMAKRCVLKGLGFCLVVRATLPGLAHPRCSPTWLQVGNLLEWMVAYSRIGVTPQGKGRSAHSVVASFCLSIWVRLGAEPADHIERPHLGHIDSETLKKVVRFPCCYPAIYVRFGADQMNSGTTQNESHSDQIDQEVELVLDQTWVKDPRMALRNFSVYPDSFPMVALVSN
jgi:hypothetical protein